MEEILILIERRTSVRLTLELGTGGGVAALSRDIIFSDSRIPGVSQRTETAMPPYIIEEAGVHLPLRKRALASGPWS